jgi:hypothetical protein
MIRRGEKGIVCQHDPFDETYMDGGDSARVTGLLAMSGESLDRFLVDDFVNEDGLGVRHPTQTRNNNNNPNNFTRDQLLCLMAGLNSSKTEFSESAAKKLFYSHAKRAFFCQNTHDQKNVKKLWYKSRDPLHPGQIGFLIQAARIRYLYPLLIFCYPFLLLELLVNVFVTPYRESNQILSVMNTSGSFWIKLYCKLHPNWKKPITDYWSGYPFRDQPEIAEIIINYIETRIKG